MNATVDGRDDSLNLFLEVNMGMWVWVHDPDSPPKTELFNNYNGNGILVTSGFSTQLMIDKTVEKKLGKPYNNCFENYQILK